MTLTFENRDPRYGPPDRYASVAEFEEMCRIAFGEAPKLTVSARRVGDRWQTLATDPEGWVVLIGHDEATTDAPAVASPHPLPPLPRDYTDPAETFAAVTIIVRDGRIKMALRRDGKTYRYDCGPHQRGVPVDVSIYCDGAGGRATTVRVTP